MAEFKRQTSGVAFTGQGAVEHIELMSITGAVTAQLIDSATSAGIAFLDLAVPDGESRESNKVRYVKTGVYLALTGSGICNFSVR